MVKLVLLHKADSIYDDEPDRVYDFPRAYLKAVQEGVGDWVIYYEPVKAGPRGYFAVARIDRVIPKPGADGRYLAIISPGSYLPFDREVPRLVGGGRSRLPLRVLTGCRSLAALSNLQSVAWTNPTLLQLFGGACQLTWKPSRQLGTIREGLMQKNRSPRLNGR